MNVKSVLSIDQDVCIIQNRNLKFNIETGGFYMGEYLQSLKWISLSPLRSYDIVEIKCL